MFIILLLIIMIHLIAAADAIVAAKTAAVFAWKGETLEENW